jgi:hypothetical protein
MAVQKIGLPPRNKDTLDYTGRPINVMPTFQGPRDPGGTDKNYPIQTIWRNSTNNNEWILVGFSGGLALWKMFAFGAGTGTVNSLTGNDAIIVGPNNLTGNINVVGDGTTVTTTGNAGTNTLTISLVGGGPAIETLTVDFTSGPPPPLAVIPNTGDIKITSSRIATNQFSSALRTATLVANTINLQIQEAGSNAAVATANKYGVSQYDANQFTVTSGFVSLVGGGGAAVQSNTVDTFTAPAITNVVSPNSGTITVTGAQVATGTVGANVIRTDSKAVGSYTIEIQRSTMVGAVDSTKNGVCHFDSADFSVDGNGFVSLNGTGIFLWQTTSVNIANLSVNHGYLCISPGGALTLGLPATAALGDEIEITLDGATSFQITQAAGQQIRYGNFETTLGATGTLTSSRPGDTVRMVAQTATRWNVLSSMGNLVVA